MWAAAVAALLCLGAPAGGAVAGEPPSLSDVLRHVDELIDLGAYAEAAAALAAAPGCRERDSAECLIALAHARNLAGDYERALGDASAAVALGPPADRTARARLELGRAQLGLVDSEPHPTDLEDAAASCRSALREDESAVPQARYWLGVTLLRMGRMSKGRHQLERFATTHPDDELAERARWLVERPDCAGEACLPPLSLTTEGGERLDGNDLADKIVLIDFWASWCPPCVEALPRLEELGRRFAGEPFVAFGINVDSDRRDFTRFVEQHDLRWPQYWDDGRKVSHKLFNVRSYPTLVLVDRQGVIRFTAVGWSGDVEAALTAKLRELTGRAPPATGQD